MISVSIFTEIFQGNNYKFHFFVSELVLCDFTEWLQLEPQLLHSLFWYYRVTLYFHVITLTIVNNKYLIYFISIFQHFLIYVFIRKNIFFQTQYYFDCRNDFFEYQKGNNFISEFLRNAWTFSMFISILVFLINYTKSKALKDKRGVKQTNKTNSVEVISIHMV